MNPAAKQPSAGDGHAAPERPLAVGATNPGEDAYLALLRRVLERGDVRQTRNGTTRALFGAHLEFDIRMGVFPLLTTKKMFFRGIIEELLFFLRGETDTKALEARGVHIWQANTSRAFLDAAGLAAYAEGEMGPMYGHQLRNYGGALHEAPGARSGVDQFESVLQTLCADPTSRRLVMTTLNPAQVHEGVLWPCHGLVIQFYVHEGRLSCHMYQRSADVFLGLPFNIASYAALVEVVCFLCRQRGTTLVPGTLHIALGDVHLYEQHVAAAQTQLARAPKPFPTLLLHNISGGERRAEDLRFEHFVLLEYQPHAAIKAEMVA